MSTADTSDLLKLPPRDPQGHKGTFGTLAVVGGCGNASTPMIGAPALAARAAFRSGCGRVRLAMPRDVLVAGLQLEPSATGIGLDLHRLDKNALKLIQESDALVVGPGLGVDRSGDSSVAELVQRCLELKLPTVLDADGLNALAANESLRTLDLSRCILTPHPGEFARLASSLGISVLPTGDADRCAAANLLAQKLGAIVVLKGARTVVADGMKCWVCQHSHACMATAGTGDVLAGLLGSLCAQLRKHDVPLYEIARLGVEAHAQAGEAWAKRTKSDSGLLAREQADELPAVLTKMR